MIMSNEEKHYTIETAATYEDVPEPLLRAYNRLCMLQNIEEDLGEDFVERYASQFSKGDTMAIHIVGQAILTQGKEAVLKQVLAAVGEECPD